MEKTNMKKFKMIKSVFIATVILVIMGTTLTTTSSAATVELVSPAELPTQLREGDKTNFTINIGDYETVKSITIDTSLISSDNKPIYDFGALNPSITDNRYNQTITIDTSLLQQKEFRISISGKAPIGETEYKVKDTNIVIRKFSDSSKNYYEVHADGMLADVKSFELVIKIKDDFVKTMDKITWKELDGTKKEVMNLFNSGLTAEAQNIANELIKITVPGSLSLFGIIKLESDMWINIMVVVVALIMFCIGFIIGRRNEEDQIQEE
jgi:hypothetical protein